MSAVFSRRSVLRATADDWINPLGVKGLGELGNVGVNVGNRQRRPPATGVRVRDLPIRLEKPLPA